MVQFYVHVLDLWCSSEAAPTRLVNLCHTVTAFPSISSWDHTKGISSLTSGDLFTR